MEPLQGRWVCRRCYESNDADAAACARCGLERGADPATAPADEGAEEGAAWQASAPQPAAERPAWLGLLMRYAWIGVVIVIAGVGILLNARRDDTGQISSGGTLHVADLRVGDCFTLKDEGAETVEEVDAKPCGEEHAYELFHAGDVAVSGYPSDEAFDQWVGDQCVPAFAAYLGGEPAPGLDFGAFTPTTEAWDAGDHSVQCVLYDTSGALLTGSMRDAAR